MAHTELPELILASSSPRRRELLGQIVSGFRVESADIDETPMSGEDPVELASRLARQKAEAVASRHDRTSAVVLAADTVVAVGGKVLEKPASAEENAEFLRRLAGRPHLVITGHALMTGGTTATDAPVTKVLLRELSEAEIARYAGGGEGLDKAGGYGIQGLGGMLIDQIQGDYTNVIGLSLPAVQRLMARMGVSFG